MQNEIDLNNANIQKSLIEKAKKQAEYKAVLQDQKSEFNHTKIMNELNYKGL